MTCALTWFKVRKSCASRRPHSLAQNPSGSSSRTWSRRLETELGAVDDRGFLRVSTRSLRSTTHCWESPFCPLNQVVSSTQSAESSLHMLGRQTLKLRIEDPAACQLFLRHVRKTADSLKRESRTARTSSRSLPTAHRYRSGSSSRDT